MDHSDINLIVALIGAFLFAVKRARKNAKTLIAFTAVTGFGVLARALRVVMWLFCNHPGY